MRSVCLLVCSALLLAPVFAGDPQPTQTISGKLNLQEGKPPLLQAGNRKIVLEGDEVTTQVLADPRVNGFEVQARGRFTSRDHFRIDASHTHPMLVRQNGHLKLITYWCDVCSIRAYTPGPCACCQKETTLDLRDPDEK